MTLIRQVAVEIVRKHSGPVPAELVRDGTSVVQPLTVLLDTLRPRLKRKPKNQELRHEISVLERALKEAQEVGAR